MKTASKKAAVKKAWVMPAWMEPYRALIVNTGGNSIEDLMNDTESNMQNNHIRTALITAVKSQLSFLELLRDKGMLDDQENRAKTLNFGVGFVTGISAAAAEGADDAPLAAALSAWGYTVEEIDVMPLEKYDREHLESVIDELENR